MLSPANVSRISAAGRSPPVMPCTINEKSTSSQAPSVSMANLPPPCSSAGVPSSSMRPACSATGASASTAPTVDPTPRARRPLAGPDVARELSGWPIYTWYFVEASARTIELARSALGVVPEVRLAVTSPSRYNLILAVWLRQLADINRFEMALGSALQDSRISDRSVVVRIRKHMAHRLGPDTRSIGIAATDVADRV